MSARDRESEQGEEAVRLAKQAGAFLAGRGPAMQGAILADLLAMWLAGHPAEVRESILDLHLEAVRLLVPVNEAMLRDRRSNVQ
jgi:hypothetical protein